MDMIDEKTARRAWESLDKIIAAINEKSDAASVLKLDECLMVKSLARQEFSALTPAQQNTAVRLVKKFRGGHRSIGQRQEVAQSQEKSSGIIRLRTPYNPAFIEAIHQVPKARWNAAEKAWEIPRLSTTMAVLAPLQKRFDISVEVIDVQPVDRKSLRAAARIVKVSVCAIKSEYNEEFADAARGLPGAKWNKVDRQWEVPISIASAEPLKKFFKSWFVSQTPDIPRVMQRVENAAHEHEVRITRSLEKHDPRVKTVTLGGELRDFQQTGVSYMLAAEKAILGDEMGTGKTVQALAALEAVQAFPAIIVAPASLLLNWERESHTWLPQRSVSIVRRDVQQSDIVVTSYERMVRQKDALAKMKPASIIFDESQYLKNGATKRAKAAKTLARKLPLRFLLTGTALLNRPFELISQLDILGLLDYFGGRQEFIQQFCNPQMTKFGWDYSGASNLDKLYKKLSAICYIRREKKDVLKELPDKQRVTVPIEISNQKEYNAAEAEVAQWLKDHVETALNDADTENVLTTSERKALAEIKTRKALRAQQLARINVLRQVVALGKLSAANEWIRNMVDSGEKVIVFAHHREVLQALFEEFPGAVHIFGGDSLEDRQAAVDKFQTDPQCMIFIGSIQAAGVGNTLTAASNVLFVELDWTPGQLDQCEDRAHRKGQKKSVTAWYLIGADTIDETMWTAIQKKRGIVDQVLTGKKSTTQMTSVVDESVTALLKI